MKRTLEKKLKSVGLYLFQNSLGRLAMYLNNILIQSKLQNYRTKWLTALKCFDINKE